MDVFTTVFTLSLIVFFFVHCFYFFNLNWKSRILINFSNLFTLWFYFAYLVYFFLEFRTGIFVNKHQHLLLLGIVLLIIFIVTDFFSGTKSLGLLFSILILLLGTTGMVNIQYQEVIYLQSGSGRFRNFLQFLDQLAVLFFFIAFLLSLLYHYSFLEVKYHRRFFFLNRFPGFNWLWYQIDGYLLGGIVLTVLSLFLSLQFDKDWALTHFFSGLIGVIMVAYYLCLFYIRYRRWFSSKMNLYWMFLGILLLISKVRYWV